MAEVEIHTGHGPSADAFGQRDEESRHAERRALRFDIAEGFLELGLVMSSRYFLSRKRFFVAFGGLGAIVGTLPGIAGWVS